MQAYPLVGHGHKGSKKEHMKKIIDEENLDAPKDSVEFIQYVRKHGKKVQHHKKRLHRLSKLLMFVGVAALGYFALRHFIHRERVHGKHDQHFSGKSHKLGASAEGSDAYGQTFSALSLALWGLVVSKAKAGMDASKSTESASVGGLVKKVGVISALIACASVFQLMSTMNTSNPVKAVTEASHKLQASAEQHPSSFYDSSSSHYQGGAHNVLINAAKDGKKLQASQSSASAMGGNHNVAMAVLAEKSNEYKRSRQATKKSSSVFGMFTPQRASGVQF